MPTEPIDYSAPERPLPRIQPYQMRDIYNSPATLKPFDLANLGLNPEEIAKQLKDKIIDPLKTGLQDGLKGAIYNGLQAARGGVDDFAAYFRDQMINTVFENIAGWLAASLSGGTFTPSLFGVPVGGGANKSLADKAFASQQAAWRMAR